MEMSLTYLTVLLGPMYPRDARKFSKAQIKEDIFHLNTHQEKPRRILEKPNLSNEAFCMTVST